MIMIPYYSKYVSSKNLSSSAKYSTYLATKESGSSRFTFK